MERVLGILGSAVLLSLLSVVFLIVDAPEAPSQPQNVQTDEKRSYDELSDDEKLERLRQEPNTSSTTSYNRAIAYQNRSYCDRIHDTSLVEQCKNEIADESNQ